MIKAFRADDRLIHTVKPYKAQIGSIPTESLVGLIFLLFFKFICKKCCPRLDIGRKGLFSEIYEAVSKPLLRYE